MVALFSERMQRVARRHLAVILAFKVVRRVLVRRALAVGGLLVVQHGDRREQLGLPGQHGAFDGGVERPRHRQTA